MSRRLPAPRPNVVTRVTAGLLSFLLAFLIPGSPPAALRTLQVTPRSVPGGGGKERRNAIPTTLTLLFHTHPLNAGKQQRLRAAQASFRELCRFFVGEAVQHDTTSRSILHRTSYRAACARTHLNPATVQLALEKALGALRGHYTRVQQGRQTVLPSFARPVPLRLRQDYYRLVRTERDTWMIQFPVAKGEPRIVLPLPVAEYHRQRLRELQEGRCRQGTLELWEGTGGRWHVAVTLVQTTMPRASAAVLGVDLGLTKLAVLSHGRFYDGRADRWRRARWAERRRALQQAGRLARVKREAGRERRWTRARNHQLSRRIVNEARAVGQALALERLTGIGTRVRAPRRLNRELHSGWVYRQLGSFIRYKAEQGGVPVVAVDPRYSSQTCSRCGYRARTNRKTQGWFHCRHCAFQLDADLNAARNLAARGHLALGL